MNHVGQLSDLEAPSPKKPADRQTVAQRFSGYFGDAICSQSMSDLPNVHVSSLNPDMF